MNIARIRLVLRALQSTKRERKVLMRMSRSYARFQAEEAKIAAGTHRRIEDPRPFRRKKNGKSRAKNEHVWRVPKSERQFCGASTRGGSPCRARACVREDGALARRCRLHGGLSTGAKTEAGRARIAASNRRRAEQRREAASTRA